MLFLPYSYASIAVNYDFISLKEIKKKTVIPGRYLVVALLHLPCYGMFALVLRLKHMLLESWFPQTYAK
jgi:hypothetical protein